MTVLSRDPRLEGGLLTEQVTRVLTPRSSEAGAHFCGRVSPGPRSASASLLGAAGSWSCLGHESVIAVGLLPRGYGIGRLSWYLGRFLIKHSSALT